MKIYQLKYIKHLFYIHTECEKLVLFHHLLTELLTNI